MCGRFTLKTPPDQWGQLLLPIIDAEVNLENVGSDWQPRYNIAPTQNIAALAFDAETSALRADYYRWGLIPFWADELSIGGWMKTVRRKKRSNYSHRQLQIF